MLSPLWQQRFHPLVGKRADRAFVSPGWHSDPPGLFQVCGIFTEYMAADEPNQTLVNFERRVRLGPTFAARLLGMPYISYAQCRNGTRVLKQHHEYHIEVLLLLTEETLMQRIKEVCHGER